MRFNFYLLFLLLININAFAATCTAKASSNWTLASTWSCNSAPTCNDIIVIPAGFTVTINQTIDLTGGGCAGTRLNIYGNLFFSGNSSRLDVVSTSTINIYSGGKITTDQPGNNSQKITIGNGSSEWSSNDGPISGPWTIKDGSSGPNPTLPVELIEFTGACVANGVQLNWSTATELNNDYFLIEKSSNAVEWQIVAKVAGSGTTGSINKYFHVDYDAKANELIYYRLSQVDYNQASEVFKAIEVNCGNDVPDQMLLFSNPASTELNILFNVNNSAPNCSIQLLNNLGQIVMDTKVDLIKGLNTFIFPIDINAGIFHVIFSSDNVAFSSQQLLIIK